MKMVGRLASLVQGVLCVAALAACSTPKVPVPKYVAPVSGPTARFLVRGSAPSGDKYGVYVLAKGETCADPHLVGIGDAQRHPEATTLAADSVQTVEFRFATADKKICGLRWTFTPTAGKTYLFRGVGTATGCTAALLDMTDADHMRAEPSALRRNPPGSSCMPIAQSKTVPGLAAGDARTSDDAVLRQSAGTGDLDGLIGQ